jgi:hypothetical protein
VSLQLNYLPICFFQKPRVIQSSTEFQWNQGLAFGRRQAVMQENSNDRQLTSSGKFLNGNIKNSVLILLKKKENLHTKDVAGIKISTHYCGFAVLDRFLVFIVAFVSRS